MEARETADAVYMAVRERGIRGATIMRVPPSASRSSLASADVPDQRWVYPYVEDPHSSGIYEPDDVVLRPVLEIELLGPGLGDDDVPPRVAASVDSGAERTFAAPWLALAIGVDLRNAPEIRVGLGGASQRVQFAQVILRLIAPDETTAVEWLADVGFIASWEPPWGLLLGQRGFFDHFTVTLNRYAQGFAINSATPDVALRTARRAQGRRPRATTGR